MERAIPGVVVKRAELIVIARIKTGSVKKNFHDHGPGRGFTYEHSAILIVSHVIKGELHQPELPIMIHYGLLPVSNGWQNKPSQHGFAFDDAVHSPPEFPGESTIIYEANPDPGGLHRPSGEIHHKQIWLLRHNSSPKGKELGYDDRALATTNFLGIWDPEDLKPSEKLQELAKYIHAK